MDDNGRQVMSTRLETSAALELSAALALEAREEVREKDAARETVEQWAQEFERPPAGGFRQVRPLDGGDGGPMFVPIMGAGGGAPGGGQTSGFGSNGMPITVTGAPRATPGDRLE